MARVGAQARDLHGRGRAAIESSRSGEGIRLFRRALRLIGWPDAREREHQVIAARILISMAAAEVHLGRSEEGFRLLDEAERVVAPEDRSALLSQRGLLCILVGRMDDALHHLNEGISLNSDPTDQYGLATDLMNRGMLHGLAGRARLAKIDLERCETVAHAADLPLIVAKARLNLGYCETLRGDIPAALRAFTLAGQGFAVHAPKLLAVVGIDKARALMQAGLADEAASELDEAIRLLGRRPTYERAEAALTRAQAAVAQQQFGTARSWARRSERYFLRRGDSSRAAVAVLTRLRADFCTGKRLNSVEAEAAELAIRLRGLGLQNDAETAGLLASRAATRRGRLEDARRHLATGRSAQPVLETVLLRRMTTAELHLAAGRTGDALRQARSGLSLLHEHRGRLGSLDLRTGAAALASELAAVGLATTVRHSSPARIFGWAERSRAQAFLMRPVRPPFDAETSDAAAELRRLAVVIRDAELAGRPDVEARRRCTRLEHLIRERGWRVGGDGGYHHLATLHHVSDELSAQNAVMVSFMTVDDELLALAIADGRADLVRLGDRPTVVEAITRLRADLDALCGRRHPPALREVMTGSVDHQLTVLGERLVRPFEKILADRDLVVVPTGPLAGIPWGLLDALRGRPVTVTPSASSWLRGTHAPRTEPSGAGPLLVAGPGLEFATAEIGKIAGILPASTMLTGDDATVAATLAHMDNRRIVHFAAHGHHEPGNILFSRLDLADGPLMAYDIEALPAAPEHVVLSSCDTGRSVMRTGDEMLGYAAAFLYSGTKTVVAAVARVADDTAVDVMSCYHDLLHRGATPARALAKASQAAPLVPLVSFGS
ncbi:CHAT domain-containing protein [Amycolatopsis sp. lyj-109]|uniref:CHAT domain-containing protein n=1 Tax=Amycolatopsis sp. lyj-109 TaxID=2789287 RepID=UPI00397D4E69